MSALRRIGLWFISLLFSVAVFSFLFGLLNSRPGGLRASSILLVFRATMIFAFPASCLYLPFVIALKDAEGRRCWTILFSGIVIGPASLVIWGVILQLRGADPYTIWRGDPLLFGLGLGLVFALIVGFLATSFYVIALKVLCRRPTAIKGRFT